MLFSQITRCQIIRTAGHSPLGPRWGCHSCLMKRAIADFMGSHSIAKISLDVIRFHKIQLYLRKFQRISQDSVRCNEISWDCVRFHYISYDLIRFQLILLDFIGFRQISSDFIRCHSMSLDVIRFHVVLLDFNDKLWVDTARPWHSMATAQQSHLETLATRI